MTINYPLTLPLGGIATARIRHTNRVAIARSTFTAEAQKQRWPGERFEFDVAYRPYSYAVAQSMRAMLAALYGGYGTLLFGDPDYLARGPRGVNTGTPVVNGSSTPVLSETLPTKGWTPSVSGILLAGDMIQLGSGSTSRLHLVLFDADSDSAGYSTLDIWPRLRSAPANNAPIVVAGAKGVFEMNGNSTEYSTDQNSVYAFSFSLQEAL